MASFPPDAANAAPLVPVSAAANAALAEVARSPPRNECADMFVVTPILLNTVRRAGTYGGGVMEDVIDVVAVVIDPDDVAAAAATAEEEAAKDGEEDEDEEEAALLFCGIKRPLSSRNVGIGESLLLGEAERCCCWLLLLWLESLPVMSQFDERLTICC